VHREVVVEWLVVEQQLISETRALPSQLDEVGATEAVTGARAYVFYEVAVLGSVR